jgi:methylated-DNA-[protein]-cysteine S-methyltransferase
MPKLSKPQPLRGLTLSQRQKVTPFRAKVLDALCQVPRGQVTTYKILSRHIGCGSSQAIGQALKHNPFAPQVPCHRVVKTNRSIGGFGGMTSGCKIDQKIALLTEEGVEFSEDGTVCEKCIYSFD